MNSDREKKEKVSPKEQELPRVLEMVRVITVFSNIWAEQFPVLFYLPVYPFLLLNKKGSGSPGEWWLPSLF